MYSVPMACVDFLPVGFFLVGIFILQRDLYNKMSKGCFALFCAGTIDVFMAGFLKAVYKLLYALNVCDFEVLSKMFFPVQTIGFVLSGMAVVCMLIFKQKKSEMVYGAAAPMVFSGTMLFVVGMILGLLGLDGGLAVVAKRMNKKNAMVLFIVSFVFCLMMGYLSSKDFTQSYMNWAAEAVNTIGQCSFMLGVIILDKAGLEQFQWNK